MAENKKGAKEGKEGGKDIADRRRLNYLKTRAREIRAELQANKKETDDLRKKMGMGPRTKKKAAGGGAGDDGED